MKHFALAGAALVFVLVSCGSSDSGSAGTAGNAAMSGAAGLGPGGSGGSGLDASAGSGGTGGNGGASGSTNAEACKAEACASVPGCAGCEQWCEASCNAEGCGFGIGCRADYVAACFAGKSCDVIASQNTLVKDAELYGCLVGVPMNEVCGFEGGSPETCWKCTYEKCTSALDACDSDGECQKWLACVTTQDCPTSGLDNTPGCYRECDDKFPNAAALYKAIYSCTCTGCAICNVHQGACGV